VLIFLIALMHALIFLMQV